MSQQEEYTKLLKENVTKTYQKSACKNYWTLTVLQSVNQWKDTSLIEWFINIKNKEISCFIVCDIENFYSFISADLFKSAIQVSKEWVDISDFDLSLINQAWKALLFHETTPWVKKGGSKDFDVRMGCFDGAEVCELVSTCILNQLKDTLQHHSVGLYRDDGLVAVKGLSGSEIEKWERVIKIFKDCGLKITIKENLKKVHFLDVTFNLHKNIMSHIENWITSLSKSV